MRKELIEQITRICDAEIAKKMWGARIHNSEGNIARYLITDFRAFGLLSGMIRYISYRERIDEKIFYRGQNQEWPLKPKLYRSNPSDHKKNLSNEEIKLANEWMNYALKIVEEEGFDFAGTDDERTAMAQHYGLATDFIDVVDHIQTALWFAYDGLPDNASVGYVYILSVPLYKAKIIDLRNKPSEWLRPQVQQAFCFKMNKATEFGKISERYHVMTLVVPRDLLRLWSNYDVIGKSFMYPPDDTDRACYYWSKAEQHLNADGLRTTPTEWISRKLSEEGMHDGK